MGKIQLIRVDDRLIHGQVMTKWSKGLGTNALYVVDNGVASDEFMKKIYITTNSSAGLKIKVFSIDEVVASWKKDEFGKDKAILLFKSIAAVEDAHKKGLPVQSLNIGGIAKKPDATFIISSVGLTKQDAEKLQSMENEGTEVFFQTVPDTKKVTLTNALKML